MSESEAAVRAAEEQITRIDSPSHPKKGFNKTIFPFLLFKFAPWILYLWYDSEPPQILAAFTILVIVDLLLCRRIFGPSLVGLSWSIEFPTAISYQFEPDPFVPTALNSNVFWIALILNFFGCIIAILRNLLGWRPIVWQKSSSMQLLRM
jgi:hypothetical protein